MTWITLIPIVAQYGIPLAESLFQKWTKGTPPTQADFDELRALANVTAVDRVKAQLAAQGIALDSKQALDIIALVS